MLWGAGAVQAAVSLADASQPESALLVPAQGSLPSQIVSLFPRKLVLFSPACPASSSTVVYLSNLKFQLNEAFILFLFFFFFK